MNSLKLYSNIFLWVGRIFIFIIFILEFIINFIFVSSDSWLILNRSEIIGFRNILIIMAPFSLLIGHVIKKIYIELDQIKNLK